MLPSEATRSAAAAQFLLQAHHARAPFGPFPSALAPGSAAEAYDIQDALVALKARTCGPVAGYKLALTTPQMRRMVGHDEPIAGAMFEGLVRSSPALVRADDYSHLLVEFEIALRLGIGLPADSAPFSRAGVSHAVESVMPAFELADDRNADYAALPQQVLALVADNAWNEGVVLGEPRHDWQGLDLAALRGVATLNGEPVGEGRGGDALGHPLEALAWVANHLAARGRSLRRGDIVITGSLVTSKFPRAGDRLEFSVDALGEVALSVD